MEKNDGKNWKAKYFDLRDRYIKTIDVSYRNGYEAGYSIGQQEAQAQNMAMQMQGQGQPQPKSGPQEGQSQEGQAGELDQYIQALEEAISKSEPNIPELKKTLSDLKSIVKSEAHSIKHISPFQDTIKYSDSFKTGVTHNDKQALSMQSKIVDDVLSKWKEEEKEASNGIEALLNTEILKKGL